MNPLAQLNDIHTPEPIGWWPLAPFSWAIIALATTVIVLAVVAAWRSYRSNRYRRAALRQLQQQSFDATPNSINKILKATAIAAYGQHTCGALHGHNWLNFLAQSAPKARAKLQTEHCQVLGTAAYQANPKYDSAALIAAAQAWVKLHRKRLPANLEDSDV
ncbi:DUF4381 domain-containing protein [Gilvimarinus agarilyticus]|uniref:DUF4381 domain-containing protein n=1 Tax=Gilvimarinus sp. 2_MG-2023 TaxID=3062666 RepID=UPI001C095B2E|nr:DUF4381 domain-containing protein [Gilvimarinus sp. 2_MG-2023]MBU2886998.1 DUF4381 domain-containing protein [Gilvimarinus agarilyticus]MDO6571658.1 DUF4381 domain-containing protein [Gilvimarinus sp. 2_MG-2023]